MSIGCILMETMLAELRAKGWEVACNVLVDNHPALALYARIGCREVGIVREYRVSQEGWRRLRWLYSDQFA